MNKKSEITNYEILSIEILILLRGDRSQREFSHLLGYSFNQVGKWESGVTKFKWSDFVDMALILKLPIETSFRQLFWSSEGSITPKNTLKILEAGLNLQEALDFKNKYMIKKWIAGTSSPSLSQVLETIDTRPAVLIGWLSYFIDCSQLNSLKKAYLAFELRLKMISDDPNCVFVNAALKLDLYKKFPKHNEEFLAENAACSIKELRKTISTLKKLDIITFDGSFYSPSPFDFSFSRLPIAKIRNVTKYATDLAAKKYPVKPIVIDRKKTPNKSISSYRVAAMSEEASIKVNDLVSKFHNDVADIVDKDYFSKTNVQIIVMHSFASNIT